jgi:hypothetical protein
VTPNAVSTPAAGTVEVTLSTTHRAVWTTLDEVEPGVLAGGVEPAELAVPLEPDEQAEQVTSNAAAEVS